MDKLILHPTETSQWQALVLEAQASTQLILNENTESYLVFLLMRFSNGARLIDSVIALDFLHTFRRPHRLRADLLRDVGDKSLLFCGLFPGMAEKRRVNVNYFIDMGQAAYLTISEQFSNDSSDLFLQLSDQFTNLQKILQAMRYEDSFKLYIDC